MALYVFNDDKMAYGDDFIKKNNLIFYHDKAHKKIRWVSKTDFEHTSENSFKEGMEKLKDEPKYMFGNDGIFLVTTDENLKKYLSEENFAPIEDNEAYNLAEKCQHLLTAKLNNVYVDFSIPINQAKFEQYMGFYVILGSKDKNKLLDSLAKIVNYQRHWDKQFGGQIATTNSFFDASLTSYGMKTKKDIRLNSLFRKSYDRNVIREVDSFITESYNNRDFYENYILKNLLTEEEFERHELR